MRWEYVRTEETYTCWYKAVVGVAPSKPYCRRHHPMGCDDCWYFLPNPPEPRDKNELDDLPQVD